MPVYNDSYSITVVKVPRCKAGHLSLCAKKPDCDNCALLKLRRNKCRLKN